MKFNIVVKETGKIIGTIENAQDADHASDILDTMYPDDSSKLKVVKS